MQSGFMLCGWTPTDPQQLTITAARQPVSVFPAATAGVSVLRRRAARSGFSGVLAAGSGPSLGLGRGPNCINIILYLQ